MSLVVAMPDSIDEVRTLADAMFDGAIDPSGIRRLNELLSADSACLQAYLEMINLHGALIEEADVKDWDAAALTTMREIAVVTECRAQRSSLRLKVASFVAVMVGCVVMAWVSIPILTTPTLAGVVVGMSINARSNSGALELGDALRKGMTLEIEEGIVTIEMNQVLVDLIGPGTVRLDGNRGVQLHRGKLAATVQPGGEGFAVRTPDARVVDLGTEFSVAYEPKEGTEVAVLRGRAQASLLDKSGVPLKILELSTNRAARLSSAAGSLSETAFRPELFEQIHRTRGSIRNVSGQLRLPVELPASLEVNQLKTLNHMLVIPEQRNVVLEEDLIVHGLSGQKRIPKGKSLSSYLVHYDPNDTVQIAPRGTISFFETIAAVIVSSEGLQATDQQFGLASTEFSTHANRGLEMDLDQVQVSSDMKGVSVFFGMAPPVPLDEMRILVVSE